MPHIVFSTFGSYGDINPFLGIGCELRKRGHNVVVASNKEWRGHVEDAGLGFRAIRPGWTVDPDPVLRLELFSTGAIFPEFEGAVQDLLNVTRGTDALVSLTLAVAAPVVAKLSRVRWISAILEPMSFFSAYEPAVMPGGGFCGVEKGGAPVVGTGAESPARVGTSPGT